MGKAYLKDKRRFNLTRKAAIETCARGISGNFLGENLRLKFGERYSDGYKSELVADLQLQVNMIIKHGGSEILQEAEMMRKFNRQRPKLCPEVYGTYRIEDNVNGLLLEKLAGYTSLYSAIYEGEGENSPDKIRLTAQNICRRLEKFYLAHSQKNEASLDFVKLYTDRIQEKLKLAKEKKFGNLLSASQVVVNGLNHERPENVLRFLSNLGERQRVFTGTHLVHGDPHLGNLFARRNPKRGYSIKLIDPNPSWGYSDYLYDIGKLYHWAEEVGFVNYENRAERNQTKRRNCLHDTGNQINQRQTKTPSSRIG